MAYLSLYRKYRSQSFEDVSGQEHVTRTLQNALKMGRVAHAYLFSGPRGTGKTSTARLLARALNCERGPIPTPCGECSECQEIRDGISPSVIEIDAASSRGIDEVRDLRQRVMTVPSRPGARKVFIVDEVHMLTTEACNALLKTLEEPPAHVLFILATTDAQKLPATILSRCQRFEFRRGSVGLIGERLKFVAEAEGYSLDPEAVRLIARASGGSWRDAISLLEQVLSYGGTTVTAAQVASLLGAVEEESLLELTDGIARGDGRVVYSLVERLISEGTEPRQLARDLGEHFRALLLADAGALPPDAYHPEAARRLAEQAAGFGTGRLVAGLEALAHADREMRWSDTGRVVLEVALARMMIGASADGRRVGPGSRKIEAPSVVREPEPGGLRADRPGAPTPRKEPAPSAALTPELSANDGPSSAPAPDRSEAPEEEQFDPFEHEELPASTGMGPTPGARGSRAGPPAPAAVPGHDAGGAQVPSNERVGSPGLENVRGRWNVVIEELKRARAVTTAALLIEAEPLRSDGGALVIGFRYSTLREKWERGDHRQRLAAALQSVFSQPFPVRSEVLEEPAADASRPPAGSDRAPQPSVSVTKAVSGTGQPAAPAPSGAPDTLEGEPLLHEVIALFEGQIIEQDPL